MESFNKIVVANWKMNGSKCLVNDFFEKIFENKIYFNLIFSPPFTLLDHTKKILLSNNNSENNKKNESKKIFLAAQNLSSENFGAFTGEISAELLSEFEVDFAILGHSERRIIFSESEDLIIKKSNAALHKNITPIICIGENKNEYENCQTEKIISNQLEKIFKNVKGNFFIAYEPIWAIGTGVTPTLKEIEKINNFIKKSFNVEIFYGGSVNAKNYKEIINLNSVSGLLVGAESLNINNFLKIISNS